MWNSNHSPLLNFALLNVTDGQGNVASYDLETKESTGMYTDASSNAIHACLEGPVTNGGGYFGSGVSLSGSGTDLYTCTSGASTKLNTIYQSMTVAFWIKPGTDYVASGTGWAWSFGRKDLWRVGFNRTVPGLKFEVNDPSAGWRSASAVFPAYTGRWIHVAAVLANGQDGSFHWSNLSVYVNGERIAYQTFTSWTSVRTGSAFLYLGWDEASGASAGRFKGTVDEFRLYSTALNQSSIRGLLWFLHGSNNVLIPRGTFYGSKLYGGLNGSYNAGSPFAGATAYGNSNSLSSNLNSRVIQMVIAKNLTLAQAWGVLDLARTNTSGVVTSFPFFATSELYTLGFSWEVSKLSANTSVVNGGNYSAPPPPPAWWQLVWNTIAGLAAYAWNAVAAVGAFFSSVGKWLATAFMSVVKGLTTGNWTEFKDNVLKPLQKAFDAFVQWLMKVIDTGIRLILNPVLDWVKSLLAGWTASIASLTMMARTGGLTQSDPGTRGFAVRPLGGGGSDGLGRLLAGRLVDLMYRSPLAIAILALILAASAAEKLAFVSSAGIISLLSFGSQLIAGVIIGFLVVEVISAAFPGTILDGLIPDWFDVAVDLGFTVANFVLWYTVQSRAGSGSAAGLEFETVEGILRSTLMSLVLVLVTTNLELILQRAGPYLVPLAMLVGFDLAAVAFNVKASVIVKKSIFRPLYPLLYPATVAIWLVSFASSVTALIRHVILIAQLVGRS